MRTLRRAALLAAAIALLTAAYLAQRAGRTAPSVEALLASLSLREQLAQLLLVRFKGLVYSDDADCMVRRQGVGGVVLYTRSGGNIVDDAQVRTLTSTLQSASPLPLVIAIDQEGGRVDRLQPIRGVRPSAASLAAAGDPAHAAAAGSEDARDLARLGFQLNFAPVVDVVQVARHPLAERSFAATPDAVTRMAGAYLAALQADGRVAGTLKHFPGLGAVGDDPHDAVPRLDATRARLESVDWAPYRDLLARGDVAAVMVTHVIVASIDPENPASLSSVVVDGVLRDQLGFDGVVVADALTMKGVATDVALADVALRALTAGSDWLLGAKTPDDVAAILDRFEAAVRRGELSRRRVTRSVRRVLTLKQRLGLPLPERYQRRPRPAG